MVAFQNKSSFQSKIPQSTNVIVFVIFVSIYTECVGDENKKTRDGGRGGMSKHTVKRGREREKRERRGNVVNMRCKIGVDEKKLLDALDETEADQKVDTTCVW